MKKYVLLLIFSPLFVVHALTREPICPTPMCASPRTGCSYQDDPSINKYGCPMYPCGKLVCEKPSTTSTSTDIPKTSQEKQEAAKKAAAQSTSSNTVRLDVCPTPMCSEPHEGCTLINDSSKRSDGCPQYPCGKLVCEKTATTQDTTKTVSEETTTTKPKPSSRLFTRPKKTWQQSVTKKTKEATSSKTPSKPDNEGRRIRRALSSKSFQFLTGSRKATTTSSKTTSSSKKQYQKSQATTSPRTISTKASNFLRRRTRPQKTTAITSPTTKTSTFLSTREERLRRARAKLLQFSK